MTKLVTPAQIREGAEALKALLPTGRLHFVTALHRCMDPPGVVKTEAERARCAYYAGMHNDGIWTGNPLADPRHFVAVPVTELRGPNRAGTMIALTARGDRCIGLASALLVRLLRYDQVMAESTARLANLEREKGLIVPVAAGAVR